MKNAAECIMVSEERRSSQLDAFKANREKNMSKKEKERERLARFRANRKSQEEDFLRLVSLTYPCMP